MKKYNVLFVDDDDSVLQMMKLVLSNLIYNDYILDLHFAKSGFEAKQLIQSNNNFNLILLDIIMETENAGFDVIDFIRNHLKNDQVVIYVVSGRTGGLPKEYLYLANGIQGIINKCTIDFSTLKDIVRNSIKEHSIG